MPRRSEYAIVKKIVDRINKRGGKAINITVDQYAVVGTPDIIGAYGSYLLAIEVKDPDPNSKPSKKQEYELRMWHRAGAVAFVARNVEDVDHVLDLIDKQPKEERINLVDLVNEINKSPHKE